MASRRVMVERKAPAADGGLYKGKSDPRGRGEPRPYKSKQRPRLGPQDNPSANFYKLPIT
jgi:hypothetical protein